jgi:hypothetical protein
MIFRYGVGRVSGFQREGLGPSGEPYFVCSSRFQPWAKDSNTAMTRDTREIRYFTLVLLALYFIVVMMNKGIHPYLKPTGSFIMMYISAVVARLDRGCERRASESHDCVPNQGCERGKITSISENAQLLLGLHGTCLDSHTQYKMRIMSNQGWMFNNINSISTPSQISPSPPPLVFNQEA